MQLISLICEINLYYEDIVIGILEKRWIVRKVKRLPEQPKNVIGFLGSVSPGKPSE